MDIRTLRAWVARADEVVNAVAEVVEDTSIKVVEFLEDLDARLVEFEDEQSESPADKAGGKDSNHHLQYLSIYGDTYIKELLKNETVVTYLKENKDILEGMYNATKAKEYCYEDHSSSDQGSSGKWPSGVGTLNDWTRWLYRS